MKKKATPLMKQSAVIFMILLSLFSIQAKAATQDELAAIAGIGQLNGIALQCGYLDKVQHIKQTLVQLLPKKRELGVWFEHTTNDAFLAFIQQEQVCPGPDEHSLRLEQAISQLKKVFE